MCADASPTDVELPVWTQVEDVLQRTGEILLELSVYRGATLQIRDVSCLHSFTLKLSVSLLLVCSASGISTGGF